MQMDATLASLQIFTSRRHYNRLLILLVPPSRDDGRNRSLPPSECSTEASLPSRPSRASPPFAFFTGLLNGRLMSKWSAVCSGLCLALLALLAALHSRRFLPGNTQRSRSSGHVVDHYRISTGFKNRGDRRHKNIFSPFFNSVNPLNAQYR